MTYLLALEVGAAFRDPLGSAVRLKSRFAR
jgi:hypothetical protein